MFAIPEDCQTDVWFEALKAFIDCVEPGWCKNLQGAKQKEINKLKKYDKTLTLPKEYEIFLLNAGGKFSFYFPYKPISFSYYDIHTMLEYPHYWDNILAIGSQSYESEKLGYLFSVSSPCDKTPLVMTRYDKNIGIKIADSLRQYLCCQAFLAFGGQQFPVGYDYRIAQEHELSSEEFSWCITNYENTNQSSLEDAGFVVPSKKLQDILLKHGYREAWFSTPLDQVWLQQDSFCSISRDFDPDNIFDTVSGQIYAHNQDAIQYLINDFTQLGYPCVLYEATH